MGWLFVPPLRQFVLLAAAASLLLNVAMLMPSLYTLQVFDRVFASRSIETLLMLSALTLLSLAFAYCMDVARSRALATAGRTLHELLSPATLEQSMRLAASGKGRADADRLRDVTALAGFLSSAGVRALSDAPWLPIYLLVIGLMDPWLGVAAGVGALALALLAVVTERMTRDATDATLQQSRRLGRHAESLTRHAEAIVGMGMSAHAVAAWRNKHDQLLDQQMQLGAASSYLSALARVARQGVQVAVLAIGAWLVVDAGASPGIMVAATILLGRTLQPVEHLISGWKQLVDARGAWRRLCEPDAVAPKDARLRLPSPAGRLEAERIVFTHDVTRPALIKAVSFAIEPGESVGIAGTVAQNIARFGEVDSERVIDAAQLAQAHEMILRLPNGYDTIVGDAGKELSGGQRQRIALARALYGRPKLVVLDEPDAHLDAEGQDALRAALRALKACVSTVVVVGHRGGLMAQLDKIAVLKDGALQAFGPAATVLAAAHARNIHVLQPPMTNATEAAT